MAKKKDFTIDWSQYNLKPAGTYLDSLADDLSGANDLLKSMEEADEAAKKLLRETGDGSLPEAKEERAGVAVE